MGSHEAWSREWLRAPRRLRKQVFYLEKLLDTTDRLFQARQVRETLATALALHRNKR